MNNKNNFLITEKLFKFFNDFSKIPPKEWLFLLDKIRIQKYDKNYTLFTQGESSNYTNSIK